MKYSALTVATLAIFGTLNYSNASAKVLSCGPKAVEVSGNRIVSIRHEDGSVHRGRSVSDNWTFDGRSIVHRLIREPILCSDETPKTITREDVIQRLSRPFANHPARYGMSQEEGEQMARYTENLMRTDQDCYRATDAAKSTSRPGMFYIDCTNQADQIRRFWISSSDLSSGTQRSMPKPLDQNDAIRACSNQLRARVVNPSTYDPAVLTGSTHRAHEITGRNTVTIEFLARDSKGVERQYLGRCILEAGNPIEVTISTR